MFLCLVEHLGAKRAKTGKLEQTIGATRSSDPHDHVIGHVNFTELHTKQRKSRFLSFSGIIYIYIYMKR